MILTFHCIIGEKLHTMIPDRRRTVPVIKRPLIIRALP